MFCPKCGSNQGDGKKFCTVCGTNLFIVSQALTGQMPQPPVQYAPPAVSPLEIERQQASRGLPTLTAAAEAILARGLQAADDEDEDFGLDTETLRALIEEGLASGPAEPWNSAEVFAAIRERHAASRKA